MVIVGDWEVYLVVLKRNEKKRFCCLWVPCTATLYGGPAEPLPLTDVASVSWFFSQIHCVILDPALLPLTSFAWLAYIRLYMYFFRWSHLFRHEEKTESMTWEFRILFLSMISLPNHHGFSYKRCFSFFLATSLRLQITPIEKPNLASPVLKRPGMLSGRKNSRGWNFRTSTVLQVDVLFCKGP